jgi:hypothetical protein
MEKGKGSKDLAHKKAYESPRAIHLDEMRNGAGECSSNGSSDDGMCINYGSSAGVCDQSGNSANVGI